MTPGRGDPMTVSEGHTERTSARARAAAAMAADALVADVAACLAEEDIAILPMKGVLLQHWLYEDPSERPMTDVDLLVRPTDLERATRALCRAGYRPTGHESVGGLVFGTRFGLPLDLHPHLFDPARYRMSTDDVFQRATTDTALFGEAVSIPSPLDVYAHLVGKFGSDHLTARHVGRLQEIARMGAYLDASPRVTSSHLVACGMRRVARYVLPLARAHCRAGFAAEVEQALPTDLVGEAIARLAGAALSRLSPFSRVGAVCAHLLNDSVPRGLRSGLVGWRQHRTPSAERR